MQNATPMNLKFGAPQRRMIHHGLDEHEKNLKAAKREAVRSFLSPTEAKIAMDMVKAAREAVPLVLPDDHDGSFELVEETRITVASGLLTLSAVLLRKRDAVAEYDVQTSSIQGKVDDVEQLRAMLMDQRDLFEYASSYRDDPENTLKLLKIVLPDTQVPRLEEISEWPFSWRKEAEAWASACIDAKSDENVKIPPRPSFLPSAKQLGLM